MEKKSARENEKTNDGIRGGVSFWVKNASNHRQLNEDEFAKLSELTRAGVEARQKYVFLHLKGHPYYEKMKKNIAETPAELMRKIRKMVPARNRIVKHNLKLIAPQAIKYLPVAKSLGIQQTELYSFGAEGLADATEKYRPDKGAAFKTYAEIRINGAMLDGIRRAMRWVHSISRPEYEKLRRDAKETGQELHIPRIESLDAPAGRNSERTNGERTPSDEDVFKKVSDKQEMQKLGKAIKTLTPFEKKVVEGHLMHNIPMKLIGRHLEVTESRISQVNTIAMNKLRRLMLQDKMPEKVGRKTNKPPSDEKYTNEKKWQEFLNYKKQKRGRFYQSLDERIDEVHRSF